MTNRAAFVGLAAVASFTLMACGEDSGEKCTPGTEGCTCIEGSSCITGLKCLSNRCVDLNKKPDGADCQSDGECQSGNCVSTTVEGITVQKCAPGAVKPDGGSSCLSGTHQEKKCSDCEPNEYCEPGSSAAGIRCLQKCDIDAQCCPPLKCMQNKWVSSYQGTICSTNGL